MLDVRVLLRLTMLARDAEQTVQRDGVAISRDSRLPLTDGALNYHFLRAHG